MKKYELYRAALDLANRSQFAILANIMWIGYPIIKALNKCENEGLKTIWFSTNTSSNCVPHLRKNCRTCVYFVDFERREGLSLVGEIELLMDEASRKRVWTTTTGKNYHLGIIDPELTVLRFTTLSCNYSNRKIKLTFEPR